jgi:hypothetical protein
MLTKSWRKRLNSRQTRSLQISFLSPTIAFHIIGTGDILSLVKVALLFVSNYAFERMDGTHGQFCLLYRPPLNLRPLGV